ncbi:class I SAM-dependent methyltransferase [Streptomyces albidoflavus]|uniref:SAM-dependent methyltransferase n=1 Tax=Streptomyces TaxID=1883 RepID=UPI001EE4B71F|nr:MULTISPECIES: class I SAM-dependent methyltransferase [Streptomyces]MCG5119258.1 methyltransferase domain-containing protein [Streptomyces sp. T7(2022)]MCR0988357.1 methyltransferase domain-containing protein [Streptomyces albidoflavus]
MSGGATEFAKSAQLFNSSIATWAVSAAWDIDLFQALTEADEIDIPWYAKKEEMDEPSLRYLLRALSYADVVKVDVDRVTRGATFEEFAQSKGLFQWLTKGYGSLFQRMGEVVYDKHRTGDYIRRDSTAVSIACRDANDVFMDAAFTDVLNGLDFSVAADLGCGSGERLIQLAKRDPSVTCVGLDIAAGAIEVGTAAVAAGGLQDRVTLIRGDARKLGEYEAFKDVELMTSFLMGHDFWPREQCVELFRGIRTQLPNLKHFVLCDTHRNADDETPDLPLFTMGFETAHALMGQYIPTREEWYSVFEESGWKCVKQHVYSTPANTVIFQLERVDSE